MVEFDPGDGRKAAALHLRQERQVELDGVLFTLRIYMAEVGYSSSGPFRPRVQLLDPQRGTREFVAETSVAP